MWQNMVNVTECDHSNATNVTSETNMASVINITSLTIVTNLKTCDQMSDNMTNVTKHEKCDKV